jgi:ferredoxin
MPTLKVGDKTGTFDEGTRLVRAIEALGVDIGHRCGGKGRCTTCRVTFEAGEPTVMTEAEASKLKDGGLLGEARLSCQILLDHDMEVTPLMTLQSEGWSDTGPETGETIEPPAAWLTQDDVQTGE